MIRVQYNTPATGRLDGWVRWDHGQEEEGTNSSPLWIDHPQSRIRRSIDRSNQLKLLLLLPTTKVCKLDRTTTSAGYYYYYYYCEQQQRWNVTLPSGRRQWRSSTAAPSSSSTSMWWSLNVFDEIPELRITKGTRGGELFQPRTIELSSIQWSRGWWWWRWWSWGWSGWRQDIFPPPLLHV